MMFSAATQITVSSASTLNVIWKTYKSTGARGDDEELRFCMKKIHNPGLKLCTFSYFVGRMFAVSHMQEHFIKL